MRSTDVAQGCPTRVLNTRDGPVDYVPIDELFAGCGVEQLSVTGRVLLEMRTRLHGVETGARLLSDLAAGGVTDFDPVRVISQDHSGTPALIDLAAMRAALRRSGADPLLVDPVVPVDLVVDHSVEAHVAGLSDALERNLDREYEQNAERYSFLRWAERAFGNVRVVPPGRGIIHQLHVECLAEVVVTRRGPSGRPTAVPDTVVGTDSHTPMVNGMGVLGFGIGGIDAEAVMLGQPVSLQLAPVVGVRLRGARRPGVTATDVVLTLTEMLRARDVVGRLLEFHGDGLADLGVHDRATIANMCPEFGATCAMFPVDGRVLEFLRTSRGDSRQVDLVERYTRRLRLFREPGEADDRVFAETVELDLATVEPCVAGPTRPQDRLPLAAVPASVPMPARPRGPVGTGGTDGPVDGSVVVAAITSCTNTANPDGMLTAGLLARNAVRRGLRPAPWVKTSLAPGSRVVTRYLEESGLAEPLERLGFSVVGYGCTTCIGNSGPLTPPAARAAREGATLVGVVSGNRNFEGRVHPDLGAVYLASPPLVVAWALAGSATVDLTRDALGTDAEGLPVALAELWPDPAEVQALRVRLLGRRHYEQVYDELFTPSERWAALPAPEGPLFGWTPDSSYIVEPPFLADGGTAHPLEDLEGARVLVYCGDSVTTDHISPAGPIPRVSTAADYLRSRGVPDVDLGTFGGRRGNHEVLVRGTFANPRLLNERVPGRRGGWALGPDGRELPVYEAAMAHRSAGVPLVVVAGHDYGMGSSRDWAAKGPRLLGVRAVLAAGFERIHRSNLIGMGIVPVELPDTPQRLGLAHDGTYDVRGLEDLRPRGPVTVTVTGPDGDVRSVRAVARVESRSECECLRHGGIQAMAMTRLAERVRPEAVRT